MPDRQAVTADLLTITITAGPLADTAVVRRRSRCSPRWPRLRARSSCWPRAALSDRGRRAGAAVRYEGRHLRRQRRAASSAPCSGRHRPNRQRRVPRTAPGGARRPVLVLTHIACRCPGPAARFISRSRTRTCGDGSSRAVPRVQRLPARCIVTLAARRRVDDRLWRFTPGAKQGWSGRTAGCCASSEHQWEQTLHHAGRPPAFGSQGAQSGRTRPASPRSSLHLQARSTRGRFYVYPPAAAGASVRPKVARFPNVTVVADGAVITDVITGSLRLPDMYGTCTGRVRGPSRGCRVPGERRARCPRTRPSSR